jgi:hypothetical protein
VEVMAGRIRPLPAGCGGLGDAWKRWPGTYPSPRPSPQRQGWDQQTPADASSRLHRTLKVGEMSEHDIRVAPLRQPSHTRLCRYTPNISTAAEVVAVCVVRVLEVPDGFARST